MKSIPVYIRVAFFLFLFVLPTILLAQKKGWQDVVYLKNGSIIRGTLIPETAPETVKVETIGRNVFVFAKSEVSQVTSESTENDFKYPFTRGYLNISEVGISVGNPPQNGFNQNAQREVDFTLQTFNGYQFNPAFAVGLTTSIDTYSEITLLPVALGIRGDILKTKTRPFYGLDAGYALDWLSNSNLFENHDGGFMWSPSLGFKFSSKKSSSFVLSFGYKSQRATATSDNGFMRSATKNKFNRAFLRFGLSF